MKVLFAAILTVAASVPAFAAQPKNYHCTMTRQDSHGWIAEEYKFRIDADQNTAEAASSFQDWTNAKLKVRSGDRYRISWKVTLPASDGANLRMNYQANLDASEDTVRVRASFAHVSAANKPFGTGTCKIEK